MPLPNLYRNDSLPVNNALPQSSGGVLGNLTPISTPANTLPKAEPNTWGQTLARGGRQVQTSGAGVGLHGGMISPEDYAATVSENEAINRAEVQDPDKLRLIKDFEESEGFLGAAGEVLSVPFKNPVGMARFGVEQVGNMLPTLAGAGAGALAGSAVGPVGTAIGGILGAGAGTVGTETGAELSSELQKAGVDLTNKQDIITKLNDPKFMSQALERGLIRGGTIAGVDLATMGLGRMMAGAPGRLLSKELLDAGFDATTDAGLKQAINSGNKVAEQALDKYAKSQTLINKAKAGVLPTTTEVLGEGAGEALAQVNVGDEVDWADVGLETVGGLGASIGTTGIQGAYEGAAGIGSRLPTSTVVNPTPNKVVEDTGTLSDAFNKTAQGNQENINTIMGDDVTQTFDDQRQADEAEYQTTGREGVYPDFTQPIQPPEVSAEPEYQTTGREGVLPQSYLPTQVTLEQRRQDEIDAPTIGQFEQTINQRGLSQDALMDRRTPVQTGRQGKGIPAKLPSLGNVGDAPADYRNQMVQDVTQDRQDAFDTRIDAQLKRTRDADQEIEFETALGDVETTKPREQKQPEQEYKADIANQDVIDLGQETGMFDAPLSKMVTYKTPSGRQVIGERQDGAPDGKVRIKLSNGKTVTKFDKMVFDHKPVDLKQESPVNGISNEQLINDLRVANPQVGNWDGGAKKDYTALANKVEQGNTQFNLAEQGIIDSKNERSAQALPDDAVTETPRTELDDIFDKPTGERQYDIQAENQSLSLTQQTPQDLKDEAARLTGIAENEKQQVKKQELDASVGEFSLTDDMGTDPNQEDMFSTGVPKQATQPEKSSTEVNEINKIQQAINNESDPLQKQMYESIKKDITKGTSLHDAVGDDIELGKELLGYQYDGNDFYSNGVKAKIAADKASKSRAKKNQGDWEAVKITEDKWAIKSVEDDTKVKNPKGEYNVKAGITKEKFNKSVRWDTSSVLGNKISKDFKDQGKTRLTDKTIKSPTDLAILAQVYRNPMYETLRYFFTDNKGKIVHQTGITSRLASETNTVVGDVDVFVKELSDKVKSVGATSLYLLHNHPSGDSSPSSADKRSTTAMSEKYAEQGITFRSHVIINHAEFSTIDEYGLTNNNMSITKAQARLYDTKPSIPHPILGNTIASPDDLKNIGKQLEGNEDYIVIIGRGGKKGSIGFIGEFTPQQLKGIKGLALLRKVAKNSGSSSLFAVNVPSDMRKQAIKGIRTNLLEDALIKDGDNLISLRIASPAVTPDTSYSLGAKRSEAHITMNEPLGSEYSTKVTIDNDSGAKFSKGSKPTQQSTVVQLKKTIGKTSDKVTIVQSQSELPLTDVQNKGTINGMYNPKTGEIYLVADNISVEQGNNILNHEVVHGILKNSPAYKNALVVLERVKNTKAYQQAEQAVTDAGTKPDNVQEEILAYYVQNHPQLSWVKKLIRTLRTVIRKYFGGKMTMDDVVGIVEDMAKGDLKGEYVLDDGRVMFSKKYHGSGEILSSNGVVSVGNIPKESNLNAMQRKQVQTKKFKDWFGESKVVDENGDPNVMYHGSPTDYESFLDGEPNFFTPSTEYASVYASKNYKANGPNVKAVYIRSEKPFDTRDPEARKIFEEQYYRKYGSGTELQETGVPDWVDAEDLVEFIQENNLDYDSVLVDEGVSLVPEGKISTVVWDANQVKSAIGNVGSFSKDNNDIRYSRQGETGILSKIGQDDKDVITKSREFIDGIMSSFRQGMIDRYDGLLTLDRRVHGDDVLRDNTSSSAWVLAKHANGSEGAIAAMLDYGRIKMDDTGTIDIIDDDSKGLIEILKPLNSKAEINKFFAWMAANRAEKLMNEGRENLFTQEDITEGKSFHKLIYDKVYKEFNKMQQDVLDISVKGGILNSESAEHYKDEFYVPFYRIMEDEDVVNSPYPGTNSLARQKFSKRLKGGTDNLGDLLENTITNWNSLIGASLKNNAATQAIDNALDPSLNLAQEVKEAERNKKSSTYVLRDGKKVWYDIDDDLVFRALTSLKETGMNNGMMRVMRSFKRVFTSFTTASPQFIAANLIRDSLQASALADMKLNPVANAITGIYGFSDKNKNKRRMVASGGAFSFGHIYGNDPDAIKSTIEREFNKTEHLVKSPNDVKRLMKKYWDKYQGVSNRAENANRIAIYEKAIKDGKTHQQASFESRDLMDFSSRGDWVAVRILTDVVPFLNARLQGLDKIYRSGVKPTANVIKSAFGVGKASKSDKMAAARFNTVLGAVSIAAMALYMANKDDEDFKEIEDWERDTYFHIKIGDAFYKIPKPFEVGALATLSERLLEQIVDDKVNGAKFGERFGHMMLQTFAFNPLPQMVKPMVDLYANKNSFTGRDIESMGMRNVSPENRMRGGTTQISKTLSKGLSKAFGSDSGLVMSPVQIDFLIQQYTGWVGATAVSTLDTLVNPEVKPAKNWSEYQPFRRFYTELPSQYSKYTTQFYDNLVRSRRVYNDVKFYMAAGEYEQAKGLIQENKTLWTARKSMNRTQRKISAINAKIRMIRNNNRMSPQAKREDLRLLSNAKKALTKRYRGLT